MKISAIRATPVNIPLEAPYFWSVGTYPGVSKTVIEVETDAGLSGLGESSTWESAAPIERLSESLIGMDPLDLHTIERAVVPETRVLWNTDDNAILKTFGGIEMALWDLRGKAWNQPLYMLLGGAVRKQIRFTEYFALRQGDGKVGCESTAEQVADYCARMRAEHGSTLFEGKDTFGSPDQAIKAVKLIRQAIGEDAMLRLDANMGWSLAAARRIHRELEPCHIDNYEDPVAGFEEMAKLRQHSSIPFSSHSADLRRAVALGVPDAFVLNFTVLGGIKRTLEFVAACQSMGVGFWCYSGDTGIQTAAYLHVVAATEHLSQPSQALYRWHTDDVIEQGPFRPRNNVLSVPEGPGLGVDLSPSGLKRCHQRFCDQGPYDQYFDPMTPSRKRRLPLF